MAPKPKTQKPKTSTPPSPPSATLIPQKPGSPGYKSQTPAPIQGPALYGTADQINTPEYQEKVGAAQGAKDAKALADYNKKLLAAIAAGNKKGSGMTAAQKAELKLQQTQLKLQQQQLNDARAEAGRVQAREDTRVAEEAARKSALKTNATAIRNLLTSGSYGTQYDDLISQLNTAAGTAQGTIGSGFDALKNMIGQQSNPYAGLKFQAAEANPAMAQFLQGQGGDVNAFMGRVQAENAAGQQANQQFQNIADLMSTRQVSGQQQRMADVDAARLSALSDLSSQQAGYAFNFNKKKQTERDRLNQILLSLAAQGVDVGGIV